MPIAVQDVSRAEHRQATCGWFRAHSGRRGPLRLLALGWLGRADMQVEHVAIGVVVGVIEAQRPDRDVTRSMTWDPSVGERGDDPRRRLLIAYDDQQPLTRAGTAGV